MVHVALTMLLSEARTAAQVKCGAGLTHTSQHPASGLRLQQPFRLEPIQFRRSERATSAFP